jgi:hypothetical protein
MNPLRFTIGSKFPEKLLSSVSAIMQYKRLKMKFDLIEPDKLMWPGKYGLITLKETGKVLDLSDWEAVVETSQQLVMVPSGRKNERPTCIFSSNCDLGRVELVYQHGYIWPNNPPASGRAIMEELVNHLNGIGEKTDR